MIAVYYWDAGMSYFILFVYGITNLYTGLRAKYRVSKIQGGNIMRVKYVLVRFDVG